MSGQKPRYGCSRRPCMSQDSVESLLHIKTELEPAFESHRIPKRRCVMHRPNDGCSRKRCKARSTLNPVQKRHGCLPIAPLEQAEATAHHFDAPDIESGRSSKQQRTGMKMFEVG